LFVIDPPLAEQPLALHLDQLVLVVAEAVEEGARFARRLVAVRVASIEERLGQESKVRGQRRVEG
jgi:hypothetical protein